jgi:hypothetical protein
MEQFAPRLTDKYMEKMLFKQQQSDRPAHPNGDNDKGLHSAGRGLSERGGYEGHVAETSVYTQATLHPLLTTAAILGAASVALAAIFGVTQHQRRRRSPRGVRAWTGKLARR